MDLVGDFAVLPFGRTSTCLSLGQSERLELVSLPEGVLDILVPYQSFEHHQESLEFDSMYHYKSVNLSDSITDTW